MGLRRWLVSVLSVLGMLASAGVPMAEVAARNTIEESAAASAFLDVPVYTQQRNLSCEYASLVMALATYGTWVSEWDFDALVPLSENPHVGYRGDINGQWGNTTDYGVYPEALVEPLAQFGFRGEVIYAEGDDSILRGFLDNHVPVVIWLGMWGDQSFYEYASDGTAYKLNPGYHVVVASGYDESGVYAVDPAKGSSISWTWSDFMWMWNAMDGMALAVWPLVNGTEIERPAVCC